MKTNYQPKPQFIEQIKKLLKNKQDIEKFFESAKTQPLKSIRANTLKISPEKLIKKLKNKNWKIYQPFPKYPEIITIKNKLKPGELGKIKEHFLGHYYVQEITSMMPILALQPKPNDIFLDLAASPGSKTTQAAVKMNNQGTIIANDVSIERISLLSANLEKSEITNAIITKYEGSQLCSKLKKFNLKVDKILLDAPCSGEGNLRTNPKVYQEWSKAYLKKLSKIQKKLAVSALQLLKQDGEMIYSTCTYAPEENELVIQHLIDNFNIKIEQIDLPIKTRPGITSWNNKKLSPQLKNAKRIYHHDNNLEGFFLCKIKKM